MSEKTCGGTVVQVWETHFLRDDTEIRRSAGLEPVEAYSLFQRFPYRRVEVFAGPRAWAIREAIQVINS